MDIKSKLEFYFAYNYYLSPPLSYIENINFKNPLLMQSSQYRSKRNKKKKNYAQLEGGSNNFKKGGKLEYLNIYYQHPKFNHYRYYKILIELECITSQEMERVIKLI